MKYIALYVFLLGVGLLGCADDAYTLAVEREFTDDEVIMIESAVEEWIVACDCEDAAVFFRYDLSDNDNSLSYDEWKNHDGFGRLWKMHVTDPAFLEEERQRVKKGEGSFVGIHRDGNIGLVAEKLEDNENNFYNVMLHELGHMYGIKNHLPDGIMRSGGTYDHPRESCIDWRALSKFCEKHLCGPDAHPTC